MSVVAKEIVNDFIHKTYTDKPVTFDAIKTIQTTTEGLLEDFKDSLLVNAANVSKEVH